MNDNTNTNTENPDVPALVGDRCPETGRFLRGNKAGCGNRLSHRVAALRRALLEAGEARLPQVVAMMLDRAQAGDVIAARLFLDRCLGMPRQEPQEPHRIDLGDLDSLEGVAAASERLVRLVASGDLDGEQSAPLLAALASHRQSLEAIRVRELESRMDELEARQEGDDAP
jgi:hypothetical protein